MSDSLPFAIFVVASPLIFIVALYLFGNVYAGLSMREHLPFQAIYNRAAIVLGIIVFLFTSTGLGLGLYLSYIYVADYADVMQPSRTIITDVADFGSLYISLYLVMGVPYFLGVWRRISKSEESAATA